MSSMTFPVLQTTCFALHESSIWWRSFLNFSHQNVNECIDVWCHVSLTAILESSQWSFFARKGCCGYAFYSRICVVYHLAWLLVIYSWLVHIPGVLEANFIEPAHDKQDFERTPLLIRLEVRLKQIILDYWLVFFCELCWNWHFLVISRV